MFAGSVVAIAKLLVETLIAVHFKMEVRDVMTVTSMLGGTFVTDGMVPVGLVVSPSPLPLPLPLPLPRPQQLAMSADIMSLKTLVHHHVAVGMVLRVLIRHVAAARWTGVVGIVRFGMPDVSPSCSRFAPRKECVDPIVARRDVLLLTVASNASLQQGFGKRSTVRNLGLLLRDPDLKAASETGNGTSSATNLNRVRSTPVGSTKLERKGASFPFASYWNQVMMQNAEQRTIFDGSGYASQNEDRHGT